MTTELRILNVSSPDVECGIRHIEHAPEVCFLLDLAIGMRGDERSDLFGVVVCTPLGVRLLPSSENGTVSLRGLFVFANFSWNLLWKTLEGLL